MEQRETWVSFALRNCIEFGDLCRKNPRAAVIVGVILMAAGFTQVPWEEVRKWDSSPPTPTETKPTDRFPATSMPSAAGSIPASSNVSAAPKQDVSPQRKPRDDKSGMPSVMSLPAGSKSTQSAAPRAPQPEVLSTQFGAPPYRTNNLILRELQDKNLLKNLHAASSRLTNDDADEQASLRLYRGVLSELSSEARAALDPALLNDAEADFQAGRSGDAVKKYKLLFHGYQ